MILLKRWRMQSARKAEQVGAPQGEMPSEAEPETLGFMGVGGCEIFGFKECKGKEKGEMTFSWAESRENLESPKTQESSLVPTRTNPSGGVEGHGS